MVAWHRSGVRVKRFIRKMLGGSQPILVEGSDGLLYVLKFTNNPQGPNLPFNESMGTELFKACGIQTPTWRPLILTQQFVDVNRSCWMETEQGVQPPEAGLCFASRFVGGSSSRLREILAGRSYQCVRNRIDFWLAWLLDTCFDHTDSRQAIFVEDFPGELLAWFIDMGNLFGGAIGNQRASFRRCCYLDMRIYADIGSEEILRLAETVRSIDATALWRLVRMLPENWISASAMGGFARGLDRLGNVNCVKRLLEAMLEAQTQKGDRDCDTIRRAESIRTDILHNRIPPKPITSI